MQQQPNELSPIWAINLYERRLFRNGNAEAQCMECGQSFEPSELDAMTGHIVHKHPEYAAKLLAKQLEFGDGTNQWMTKRETEEEECCSTSSLSVATAPTADNNTDATDMRTCTTTASLSPKIRPTESASTDWTTNGHCHEKTVHCQTMSNGEELDNFCNVMPDKASAATSLSTTSSQSFSSFDSKNILSPLCPNHQQNMDTGSTSPASSLTMPNLSPLSATELTMTMSSTATEFETTTTPTTPISRATTTTITKETTNNSMTNNAIITTYTDRFGKEWRLLVSAVCAQSVDQIADERFLCRKGVTKHDGRIYFSCCWTGRGPSAAAHNHQCLHRALFLPERQALFYRRAHNHPTTISKNTNNALTIKGDIPTTSRTAQLGSQSCCQQRHQCHGRGEDVVSATSSFSAALPDLENAENYGELQTNRGWSKGTVAKMGSTETALSCTKSLKFLRNPKIPTTNTNGEEDFLDLYGRRWTWLVRMDLRRCRTGLEEAQLLCKFSREHGMKRHYMKMRLNGKLSRFCFNCCFKLTASCPYRALFVAERCAIFQTGSHVHNSVNATITMPKRKRRMGMDEQNNHWDANGNASATWEREGQMSAETTPAAAPSIISRPFSAPINNAAAIRMKEDYEDFAGHSWKWFANLDVGECKTDEQLTLLNNFCRQHDLHRGQMRRRSDGTLRALALLCKHRCRKMFYPCSYRAIYVVSRHAVFARGVHEHSRKRPTTTTDKHFVGKKLRGKKKLRRKLATTNVRVVEKAMPMVAHANDSSPFESSPIVGSTTTKQRHPHLLNIVELASSYCKKTPPLVITDRFHQLWHWLANLPNASCATVKSFCSQFYVSRMCTYQAGARIRYNCRYRLSPISCPFKVVHLPYKNVLYHRMAHNHQLPLSKEQLRQYTQHRRPRRLRLVEHQQAKRNTNGGRKTQ